MDNTRETTIRLREAEGIVRALYGAMKQGEMGLQYVPGLLRRLIDEDLWQDRILDMTGEMVHFDRFIDFVTTGPPEGLGESYPALRRLCGDDPQALDALDRVTQQGPGKTWDSRSDNIGVLHPNIIVRDRTNKHLRRLRKDFPQLHEEVLAGSKTVAQAAREAGIYPHRISINVQSVTSAAETIISLCEPDFVKGLIDILRTKSHE